MVNFKQPFPFFLNDDKLNFYLIVGVSLFNYLFLVVFQPFGPDSATPEQRVRYSVICCLVMIFNLLILPRLAVRWLDDCDWTLRKYLLFNVYNLFSISTVITISNVVTGSGGSTPIGVLYFTDLWHVCVLGAIPLVLVTFMLRNRMLMQMVRTGNMATGQLQLYQGGETDTDEPVLEIQSDTSEVLLLSMQDFLFAVADNNYSEIFYSTGDGVRSKLMRLTLKRLEEQFPEGSVFRCHRSYLVHLDKVLSVNGNANGYRLTLPQIEEEIPVSRSLGKEVLERIHGMTAVS